MQGLPIAQVEQVLWTKFQTKLTCWEATHKRKVLRDKICEMHIQQAIALLDELVPPRPPTQARALPAAEALPEHDNADSSTQAQCEICRKWRDIRAADVKKYDWDTCWGFSCAAVEDEGCLAECAHCGTSGANPGAKCDCCPTPTRGNISLQLMDSWSVDHKATHPTQRVRRAAEAQADTLLLQCTRHMDRDAKKRFWDMMAVQVLE